MAKPKNVKQAMQDGRYKLKKIHHKGSKQIEVIFEPRFPSRTLKRCSFWINRDYFKKKYPGSYSRVWGY